MLHCSHYHNNHHNSTKGSEWIAPRYQKYGKIWTGGNSTKIRTIPICHQIGAESCHLAEIRSRLEVGKNDSSLNGIQYRGTSKWARWYIMFNPVRYPYVHVN